MNTWILCADNLCAKIFMKKDNQETLTLYRTIVRPTQSHVSLPKFLQYVAEEIDLACGAGTQSQLVVCADRPTLQTFLSKLGQEARSRLIGTIGKSLRRNSEAQALAWALSA